MGVGGVGGGAIGGGIGGGAVGGGIGGGTVGGGMGGGAIGGGMGGAMGGAMGGGGGIGHMLPKATDHSNMPAHSGSWTQNQPPTQYPSSTPR